MNKSRHRFLWLCTALLIIITGCQSPRPNTPRPLYGTDNRKEVIHGDAAVCEIGNAVFAIFSKDALTQNDQGSWQLHDRRALPQLGWCDNTRFADQPATAQCTGFLIAPDLMATAGHCIAETNESLATGLGCDQTLLVLDFKQMITGETTTSFTPDQVYTCVELIAGQDSRLGPDWRVIQLDRMTNRTPLNMYSGAPLSANHTVHVVGHPLGLPMKAAGNASILGYSSKRYRTTLDTFRGNSGSPVYTMVDERPVVIGVMSGGESDKLKTTSNQCDVVRTCEADDDCRGQLVTDAQSFSSWASNGNYDFANASLNRTTAYCAWCTEPLRSRFWQCPISDSLE